MDYFQFQGLIYIAQIILLLPHKILCPFWHLICQHQTYSCWSLLSDHQSFIGGDLCGRPMLNLIPNFSLFTCCHLVISIREMCSCLISQFAFDIGSHLVVVFIFTSGWYTAGYGVGNFPLFGLSVLRIYTSRWTPICAVVVRRYSRLQTV